MASTATIGLGRCVSQRSVSPEDIREAHWDTRGEESRSSDAGRHGAGHRAAGNVSRETSGRDPSPGRSAEKGHTMGHDAAPSLAYDSACAAPAGFPRLRTSSMRFWRSAGETPGIRPACANVPGRTLASFSRASLESVSKSS